MSSSQSAGNVNQLSSHPVDSLLEDEELYTSASARHRSGKHLRTCSEMIFVHDIVQVSSGVPVVS